MEQTKLSKENNKDSRKETKSQFSARTIIWHWEPFLIKTEDKLKSIEIKVSKLMIVHHVRNINYDTPSNTMEKRGSKKIAHQYGKPEPVG